MWLTGRETAAQIQQFKRDCMDELANFGAANRCLMGAPTYSEKLPGEDRVPPVPDGLTGPAVRLLICESRVVEALAPQVVRSSGFVHDLDRRDLERLRRITRRAYSRTHPGQARLTDAECDAIIEEIGPDSAIKTLRGGVDSKAIH